ncbi:MAG: type II toxin-antitoxin system RelE/ParE family toxin [Candidatus Acidiferrales bacterium]
MPDLRGAWNWSFRGYETPLGNRLAQDWFDGLSDEAKDGARDAIGYLQHSPIHLWKRPHFEKLEDGISEVRFRVGKVRYRFYGYFGPGGFFRSYTFLHGTDKKVRNDVHGKGIARVRMGEIERKEARTHEFEFEDEPDPSLAKR